VRLRLAGFCFGFAALGASPLLTINLRCLAWGRIEFLACGRWRVARRENRFGPDIVAFRKSYLYITRRARTKTEVLAAAERA